jgi:hypothetical protein
VPVGAELLLDQWLTCGACPTKCTADGDQMLIGTCNAEGSSGTTCETCAGDCRMDMTFSTDLYMTMAEFTAAKAALFLSAIKDSTKVPLTRSSIVSIVESSTLVSSKYITVAAKIVLSKTAAATSALTSKNPAFTASTLKTALIANGFTEKVTISVFNNVARFGTHFTDKGTMLAISKPCHTKVEGIVVVTKEALEVQMKVELPYTMDSFDTDAQGKFLSAVANSVKTPVDNLYIKSVVEKTSLRRVSPTRARAALCRLADSSTPSPATHSRYSPDQLQQQADTDLETSLRRRSPLHKPPHKLPAKAPLRPALGTGVLRGLRLGPPCRTINYPRAESTLRRAPC